MGLLFSVGPWGGIYLYRGFTTRLCLGWLAVTYIPCDPDTLFSEKREA